MSAPPAPTRLMSVFSLAAALLACAVPQSAPRPERLDREPDRLGSAPRAAWEAPPLPQALSIRDGRTGALLTLPQLLDELAAFDVVFLGETHTDETTHRVELAVYEGLLARRSGRVVLALEMFERDVQADLDAYLAGRIQEPGFLERARPWANYHTAYRPLVERARAEGRPVVASNFPTPLRRRMGLEGDAALDAARRETPGLAPEELKPGTPAYWRRVDNAVRGHLALMGGGGQGPEERLTSTQSLWDNSMGEACAQALDRHPGYAVLHVNGGFHSAYWDGTVRQLALRRPEARVATVSISPSVNPAVADVGEPPVADYVVYAEARASDRNDGRWSVYVSRELEYLFHLPEAATETSRVPLLLWFGNDGLVAEDGLALWRARLGQECAIAVLDAPYREAQEDLGEGGRWFWPDSFSSDMSVLQVAAERAASFLLRHYPLDPQRIVVAGEGTGATVAAAISLLSDRLGLRGVGFEPRRYSKIRDFPLPLPELAGEGAQPSSLRLRIPAAGAAWWSEELEQYAAVGLDVALLEPVEDPWRADWTQERALREALGLAMGGDGTTGAAAPARRHIVVRGERERFWARLHALDHVERTGERVAILESAPSDIDSTELSLRLGPQSFSEGRVPPRCPGPFGGTTVLVLPPGDEGALESWLALEQNDPLQAASRFHRIRIATLDGERDLALQLEKLIDEGRRNVLIVPACFCADGPTLARLRERTRALEDELTLHWRPGLGGPE